MARSLLIGRSLRDDYTPFSVCIFGAPINLTMLGVLGASVVVLGFELPVANGLTPTSDIGEPVSGVILRCRVEPPGATRGEALPSERFVKRGVQATSQPEGRLLAG